MRISVTIGAVLLVSIALAAETKINTGPEVGDRIPPFEAIDHKGAQQTLDTLRGPKGLLLLFTRSADWCPFCKGHLVQLERQRKAFESRGYRVAALTYDIPEVLKHFAERAGINYPLLSDPDSKIIRAFGILNKTVPESHPFFGIPNPGQYLIDADGKVEAKFFEEKYSDRFTPGNILVRTLGGPGAGPRTEIRTKHLRAVASASDSVVRGGNRVALILEVELDPKMHVYAPGVEEYIPINWKMNDATGFTIFPAVYHPNPSSSTCRPSTRSCPSTGNRFRVVMDVLLGKPDELQTLTDANGDLVLSGTFRYQACDDKLCYLPEDVPLEWRFQLEAHDRTRVPKPLRRGTE